MAYLLTPKNEEEIRKTPVSQMRKDYAKMAEAYNHLVELDYIYCPQCGNWKSTSTFYSSKTTASGFIHWGCKECIARAACDYDKKTNQYKDNAEKAKFVLRTLNIPYIDTLYKSAVSDSENEINEKNRKCGWFSYMTMIQSLPNWKGKTWDDSEFDLEDDTSPEYEIKENKKTIKNGKKRFGEFYSNQDIMFLENEYQDWISRYECNTKAQESIFERLACKKLEINKATKAGENTKDLDKTYQDLLSTANIQPRQQVVDPISNAQTWGTLVQRWEDNDPILLEPDSELEDIDHLSLIVDAVFRGHTAKAVGLKNRFANIYENFMKRYTVSKPEYEEDEDSEIIFEKIFGTLEEE